MSQSALTRGVTKGSPFRLEPDGTVATDDDALSAWRGRPGQLRSVQEVQDRRYENPDDIETEAADSWNPFQGADGAFHDNAGATVSVLSTTSMAGQATRRFRANVIVDGDGIETNDAEGSRALDDKAVFTFRGEPKPSLVPDVPPVDLAKSGEE